MYIDDIERFFLVHIIINLLKTNVLWIKKHYVCTHLPRRLVLGRRGERRCLAPESSTLLRYDDPFWMSGAVKGNLNLQTILQTIFN